MNDLQRILGLLCSVALVAICNAGNGDVLSMFTGELITVEPEVTEIVNQPVRLIEIQDWCW